MIRSHGKPLGEKAFPRRIDANNCTQLRILPRIKAVKAAGFSSGKLDDFAFLARRQQVPEFRSSFRRYEPEIVILRRSETCMAGFLNQAVDGSEMGQVITAEGFS
jgi:hypothetical protein